MKSTEEHPPLRLVTPCVAPPQTEGGFREAMRELASGVCLITVGSGDARNGLTATSVSALSVDPPSLVVCVNRSASSFPLLAKTGSFGVNVLTADQRELAERFAGRTGAAGAERFSIGCWDESGDAPLLEDAAAALECDVIEILERNTHAIIIGQVRRSRVARRSAALIYWRGNFEHLGWSYEEVSCVASGRIP